MKILIALAFVALFVGGYYLMQGVDHWMRDVRLDRFERGMSVECGQETEKNTGYHAKDGDKYDKK